MKRYLIFMALVFGLASGCHAASPSFSSFYTNHFLTNGLVIKAKLNPTQFDTNASSITITITNIGDVPGSGVFTNVAGVIKPKPNQITNALLFISGSADAATNTALTVDTVNTWTDENTKLLSLRHQGTNVAYITPYGSFESGKGVASASPSRDDILLGIRDTSLGESDYALVYTAAIDGSSPTNYSVFRAQLNTGDGAGSILSIGSVTNGVSSRFTVQLQPSSGVANITLLNQDNTTFSVLDNSGYTGTGLNFLRDDGTYGPANGYWTLTGSVLHPNAGTSVLVTNLTSALSMVASGAFSMSGLLVTNLVAGNNDINPFVTGTIAATGPTTNPADTFIRLNSGIGYQLLFIRNNTTNSAFTMRNGEPQWDDPSQVIHLNGDWATTNKGDTLFLHNNGFFWAEVGRTWANTNTVAPVVMNPTDNYLPVRESAGVFADSPWLRSATNIAATLGFTRFGITNALPNFSTSPLVGIRSVPANPALTIDALQNGTQTPFNLYSVFTNGSSVPTMYLQTASAGTLGVFSRALQIDAYSQSENGSTNSPVIDNTVSGTVGIYANAAPSGGTNTTSIGVLGSSDPARGHWNVGVGAYVEPVSANSASVNTGIHSKTHGLTGSQTVAAGFFEVEATADTGKSFLAESGVIVADSRGSGVPIFIGRTAGANLLTIGNQGDVIFGPGITNSIRRSGDDLVVKLKNTDALTFSRGTSRSVIQSAGTLDLKAETSYDIRLWTGGAQRWEVDPNGHLLPMSGSTYNIGIDSNGAVGNAPNNVAMSHFLVINNGHTPASSAETNFLGAICWDANYLYVWTATNVNKRVALTAW